MTTQLVDKDFREWIDLMTGRERAAIANPWRGLYIEVNPHEHGHITGFANRGRITVSPRKWWYVTLFGMGMGADRSFKTYKEAMAYARERWNAVKEEA